ncbi:MAG: YraN family protein [Clostridia bacterium]
MDNKCESGAYGEQLAKEYLERAGYTLLKANYRALRCEIDLIMLDEDAVVFVEVKARHKSIYGLGREAVTKAKQRNIIKAASYYLQINGWFERNVRFDVAEVDLDINHVFHIKNAFTL